MDIKGSPVFTGTSIDKNGNVIAIFKGDASVKQMQVVVGDAWRDFDPGAPYVVELRIIPAQMSIADAGDEAGVSLDF